MGQLIDVIRGIKMITILEQKTVKIRKVQSCWGCCRKFNPGTRMRKIEAVDNGDFSRAYWCNVCHEIIDKMDSVDCDLGFSEGEIIDGDFEYWESVREEIESTL